MDIYTFYEPIGHDSFSHYSELIEIWEKSWRHYGWNPIILSLKDAEQHPKYEQLLEKAESLPTVNLKKYEIYCYLRWAALSLKGGWYTDVDMINYGFKPKKNIEGQVVTAGVAALHVNTFHMPKNICENLLDEIINYEVGPYDYEKINNQKVTHVSDMHILCRSKIKIDHAFYNLVEYKKGPYEEALIVHYPLGCMNVDKKDANKSRLEIIKEDKRYLEFANA